MPAYYGYMVPRDLVYKLGENTDLPYTKEDHEGTAMSHLIKRGCWNQILGEICTICRGNGLRIRCVVVIDPEEPSRDWGMIATGYAEPPDDNSE
ncbi:hypothetical protein BJ138DRAFT_1131599, partial [Hygrophoropsis aurantiaca]